MRTRVILSSTAGILILLGVVRGWNAEQEKDDDPCGFFDKEKLDAKNKACGSVKEPKYVFDFCSGRLLGSGKVAVGHMILNKRVGFVLPAGWEAAGMDFLEDCGECRFAGFETENQVDLSKTGSIQYGLKKESKKEARCYIDKGNLADKKGANARNPDDKTGNSTRELRSRIYTRWRDKGRTVNLEVFSKFNDGEFWCRVYSTGSFPVRFRFPDLMEKILEKSRTARVVTEWEGGSAKEGFAAPQGGDKPNILKISFGKDAEAEESRTRCEVLEAKESKVVATGMITIFVPKTKK